MSTEASRAHASSGWPAAERKVWQQAKLALNCDFASIGHETLGSHRCWASVSFCSKTGQNHCLKDQWKGKSCLLCNGLDRSKCSINCSFLSLFACTKHVAISDITACPTFPHQPRLVYERVISMHLITHVQTTCCHSAWYQCQSNLV